MGRHLKYFLDLAGGICSHSAKRALVTSNTDAWRLGLAHSQCSNSSQRCWIELKSELCAGQWTGKPPWETISSLIWPKAACTNLKKTASHQKYSTYDTPGLCLYTFIFMFSFLYYHFLRQESKLLCFLTSPLSPNAIFVSSGATKVTACGKILIRSSKTVPGVPGANMAPAHGPAEPEFAFGHVSATTRRKWPTLLTYWFCEASWMTVKYKSAINNGVRWF